MMSVQEYRSLLRKIEAVNQSIVRLMDYLDDLNEEISALKTRISTLE